KYSSPLTDQPDLIKAMSMDDPRSPLHFSAVNLLHPTDVSQMVPEAVSFYVDTTRRKSAAVVQKIAEQGGPGAIGKIFAAIRATKPADGAALVKLIQDQTKLDVTNDLTH